MKVNALKMNRIRCVVAIILSSILILLTINGLLNRLFHFEGVQEGTNGLSSFRMFTILSNCVVMGCATLSIPYQIDGLRSGNYHLPRWIVDTLYVGVTCVSITFLISLCVLSPVIGFKTIMLEGTNFTFHLINPILAIVLFIFLNSYHNIKFWKNFIAIAPMVIYLCVYVVEVYILKNWSDFYKLNVFMPAYVSIPLAIPVGFTVAYILRISHNKIHTIQKNNVFNYYLYSDEYSGGIDKAINTLAKGNRCDNRADLYIPRRIIAILMERYGIIDGIESYLTCYIDEYYKIK